MCAPNEWCYRQHFVKHHPENDCVSDEEDNLIVLRGGNQTTEWRFSRYIRKKCPAPHCDLEFGIRSDVRSHFVKRHTSDHFYCKPCNKLLYVRDQNDISKHQSKVHSNVHQTDSGKSFDNTEMPSTSKV